MTYAKIYKVCREYILKDWKNVFFKYYIQNITQNIKRNPRTLLSDVKLKH